MPGTARPRASSGQSGDGSRLRGLRATIGLVWMDSHALGMVAAGAVDRGYQGGANGLVGVRRVKGATAMEPLIILGGVLAAAILVWTVANSWRG
jgi:hypothetical protein